jgi:hypothetical protein
MKLFVCWPTLTSASATTLEATQARQHGHSERSCGPPVSATSGGTLPLGNRKGPLSDSPGLFDLPGGKAF